MTEATDYPTGAQSPPTELPLSLYENAAAEEDAKVAKALRFWKHPSLRDIPMDQKRQYLHDKGLTDEHIHKAWDRILEEQQPDENNHQALSGPLGASSASMPMQSPLYSQPPPQQHQSHVVNSSYPTPQYSPYQDAYRSGAYSSPAAHTTPPPRYDDDEGPGPFLQGASLVALGGLVGLTAAAAARWLNGGDFQLLPPPSLMEETTKSQQQRLILQGDSRAHDNSGDYDEANNLEEDYAETLEEEYVTDEEDLEGLADELVQSEVQEQLLEQVQSISESMKAHVAVQEKILQKLSSQGSSITNHSMELLRASSGISSGDRKAKSPTDVLQLWALLLEIKGELQNLQHDQRLHGTKNSEQKPWENQLGTVLSKLDACVETIQGSFASTKTEDKSAPSAQAPKEPLVADAVAPTIIASTPTDNPTTPIRDQSSPETKHNGIPSGTPTLRQAVRKMAQENDSTTLRVGAQLLYLYIINLTGKPSNPRYRKIFTTNDSFQKILAVAGGKDLLLAVGFEEGKGGLEWLASNPSPEAEGLAMTKLQEAASALGILKSSQPSPNLVEQALAVLSPDPDVQLVLPTPAPPATPEGTTSLISPPQPKKMPYVHHLTSEEAGQEGETGALSSEDQATDGAATSE